MARLLHVSRGLCWPPATSAANGPGAILSLMGHDKLGFIAREVCRRRESNRMASVQRVPVTTMHRVCVEHPVDTGRQAEGAFAGQSKPIDGAYCRCDQGLLAGG